MASVVRVVPKEALEAVWPQIERFLDNALKHLEDGLTIDQERMLVFRGEHTLLVALDEEKQIKGAATLEFVTKPNYRSMYIVACGGKGVVNKDTVKQLELLARANGCRYIEAGARQIAARLYRMAGFSTVAVSVRKRV